MDSDSNVAEEFAILCAMNDDFQDPLSRVAESFPGVSYLHCLALALKDSLRDVTNNENDKLVFHCNYAVKIINVYLRVLT